MITAHIIKPYTNVLFTVYLLSVSFLSSVTLLSCVKTDKTDFRAQDFSRPVLYCVIEFLAKTRSGKN